MSNEFLGTIQVFLKTFFYATEEQLLSLETISLGIHQNRNEQDDTSYLRDNPISISYLTVMLSKCKNLKKFTCDYKLNENINVLLFALKELKKLEFLEIECTPKDLSAECLGFLSNLINLNEFSLTAFADYQPDNGEHNLQENCVDAVIGVLSACKQIRVLYLEGVHLGKLSEPNKSKVLSAIAGMEKLGELFLHTNELSLNDMIFLLASRNKKDIKELSFFGNCIDENNTKDDLLHFCSLLSEFNRLDYLDLSDSILADLKHFYSSMSPVAQELKNLKTIRLDLPFFNRSGWSEFQTFCSNLASEAIESISFINEQEVNDENEDAAAAYEHNSLEIKVFEDGLSNIMKKETLRSFEFIGRNMVCYQLHIFRSFFNVVSRGKTITHLNLSDNGLNNLSPKYFEVMQKALLKMENLIHINLYDFRAKFSDEPETVNYQAQEINSIIERNKALALLPKKDNNPKSLLFLASKVVANNFDRNTNKLPFDLQYRIENYRATLSKECFVRKLFDCIENQNLGLFTHLIESNKTWKNWDLNTKNTNGQTLLYRASSKNEEGVAPNEGFLKILLENGADPTIEDNAVEKQESKRRRVG